jgi:hypothetical protein
MPPRSQLIAAPESTVNRGVGYYVVCREERGLREVLFVLREEVLRIK